MTGEGEVRMIANVVITGTRFRPRLSRLLLGSFRSKVKAVVDHSLGRISASQLQAFVRYLGWKDDCSRPK